MPDLVADLAAVVRAAAAAAGKPVPSGVRRRRSSDAHRSLAAALGGGQRRAVCWARSRSAIPRTSELRARPRARGARGATLGLITEGANSAGAYLAGAVPHREAGGTAVAAPGLAARAMLRERLKAYVLFGGIDPANDLAGAADALAGAGASSPRPRT